MALQFARDRPLQALKLGSALGSFAFALAGYLGLLPGRGLQSLLVVAFFPMLLALVVAGEAVLAGYRLARSDDLIDRRSARRGYTGIRVLEVVVTVGAPGAFYLLVVRIGGEVAGPGAIGLLLYGIALGLLAYGAVLLRTLVEYYDHRRGRSPPGRIEGGSDPVE